MDNKIFEDEKGFCVGAILSGLGTVSSVVGIKQAHDQEEQSEEQAEQQEEQSQRQEKLLRDQNQKLDKIIDVAKVDPKVGPQAAAAIRERFYAIPSSGELTGLVKNIGNCGMKFMKKYGYGSMAMAGLGAAATYGVNKFIQHDMNKSNMGVDNQGNLYQQGPPNGGSQRMYAEPTTSLLKKGLDVVKNNKMNIGLTVGLTAIPSLIGYYSKKKAVQNQIQQTGQPGMQQPGPNMPPPAMQQRSFANLEGLGGALSKFKKFGNKIVSGASSLAWMNAGGGGGKKWVANVGKHISEMGSGMHGGTENQLTKKIGNWIAKNPTRATVATIPLALGIGKVTWDLPSKLSEKALRTVDPNAYKYQDANDGKFTPTNQQAQGPYGPNQTY